MRRKLLTFIMAGLMGMTQVQAVPQQDEQPQEAQELVDSTQSDAVEVYSDTTAVDTGGVVVQQVVSAHDDEDDSSWALWGSWGGFSFMAIVMVLFTLFLYSIPLLILLLLLLAFIRLLRRKRSPRAMNNLYDETDMANNKKLYRSNDQLIAGVCAGLAEYFGFDPTIVRLVYALLTICTAFSGVLCYLVLWIIMPSRQ